MYESCLKKQRDIKALFADCSTDEAKYERIIKLGRGLKAMDLLHKVPENLVRGCQSRMYLYSCRAGDKVLFEAESDALISAGLAALLIMAYSGETAETILKCPPDFLEELNISSTLTPNRANGLFSLHLKMKQDALNLLVR